jgi:exosortase family protein XrtM
MIAEDPGGWLTSASLQRLFAFCLAFFVLQAAYESQRGTWLDTTIIESLTVAPAAALANAIAPQIGVHAEGTRIASPTERLNILPGCEGAEAFLLLMSGVLCARRAWRVRVTGLALGLFVVYAANIVRIVALFFAALRDRPMFELLHAYLAPIAVTGIAVLFFALWLTWSEPDETAVA